MSEEISELNKHLLLLIERERVERRRRCIRDLSLVATMSVFLAAVFA